MTFIKKLIARIINYVRHLEAIMTPFIKHPTTKEFRINLEWLWDGEPRALNFLYHIVSTYRHHHKMLIWLRFNGLRGMKLVEFFHNENDKETGYLLACNKILNGMDKLHGKTMIKDLT